MTRRKKAIMGTTSLGLWLAAAVPAIFWAELVRSHEPVHRLVLSGAITFTIAWLLAHDTRPVAHLEDYGETMFRLGRKLSDSDDQPRPRPVPGIRIVIPRSRLGTLAAGIAFAVALSVGWAYLATHAASKSREPLAKEPSPYSWSPQPNKAPVPIRHEVVISKAATDKVVTAVPRPAARAGADQRPPVRVRRESIRVSLAAGQASPRTKRCVVEADLPLAEVQLGRMACL